MTVDLYQPPLRYGAAYDELSADGVAPRPHWTHLMESLRAIGHEELGRRWARAERRIRENGITYNVYGDPLGASRDWKIDIVPLLIPADEWRHIEAGIIQRAQLLSRLLEDLYGEQELLAQNHFPAALPYERPQKCGVGVEKCGRKVALRHQDLRPVEILEEQIEQLGSLNDAPFDVAPLVRRNQ